MATHPFTLREERAVFAERGVVLGATVEKVFWFNTAGWTLPAATSLFSSPTFDVAELKAREARLYACKAQLSSLPMEEWKRHTASTKVSRGALQAVRRRVAPEMCTRAFCKLYEMLVAFPALLRRREASNASLIEPCSTLHLCEAPGAFVAATNHFLQSSSSAASGAAAPWQWIGSTLDPLCEQNDSDATLGRGAVQGRFLAQTREHWEFGADGSGNLCDAANAAAIVRRARALAPRGVDLVTADGSIPCWRSPGDQERLTAMLHYCEVAVALASLRPGGSFVCKIFTVFEHTTACALRLLGACFERLALCKPVASSEGNSESYIVALGCKSLPRSLVAALLNAVGPTWPSGVALLPEALLRDEARSPCCIEQLVRCADLFASAQSAVITRNLRLFDTATAAEGNAVGGGGGGGGAAAGACSLKSSIESELAGNRAHQLVVAQHYLHRFALRSLAPSRFIVPLPGHPAASSKPAVAAAAAEKEEDDGSQLPLSFGSKRNRAQQQQQQQQRKRKQKQKKMKRVGQGRYS